MDYKKAYFHLFNRLEDIIEEIQRIHMEAEEIILQDDKDDDQSAEKPSGSDT